MVMGCFRNGCEHILCSLYSREFGYICGECFEELVELGIEADIAVFMATPKADNSPIDLEPIARERLEKVFSDGN